MGALIISACLALGVSGLAAWKGGAPERWGAVVLLFGWFVSPLVNTDHGAKYGVLAVDCLCLVGFFVISLKSRSLWSLLATSCQLDDVFCHIGKSLVPHMGGYGYVTGMYIWGGYGLLFSLLLSVWERHIDQRYVPKSP